MPSQAWSAGHDGVERPTHVLGIILLIEALIPVGDMSLILTAKDSTVRALGIHGLTALLMVAGAVPLIIGLV